MRSLTSRFLIAAFALGLIAAAPANAWQNRPNVVRAAQVLASEVERFDEALHNIQAPTDLIQTVHHFEETVMEFAQETQTCTYQMAQQEMNHIRQDVGLIRNKIAQYPYVLNHYLVAQEWQHVRSAYRNLDHQMFYWVLGRWSDSSVETLRSEMADIEAAHAK